MALYTSAITLERASKICCIPKTEDKDNVTCYVIEVKVSDYVWLVSRRYKQFVELHEKLIKEYSIDKSLLPPKKIFGNRSESFINDRKKALEQYLQTLLQMFRVLPESLALFLDFNKYEVRGIANVLSEKFYFKGDELLLSGKPYEFTPLQLYAITQRLKLREPTCAKNPNQDIGHLVDFITQLKHLVIIGSSVHYEASNIIFNNLTFDLSYFKSVVEIEIFNLNINTAIKSAEILRARLKTLSIHKSLDCISDILLCGIIHWSSITEPIHTWPYWSYITVLNFSHNRIRRIDSSIKLLCSVKQIDLSHNAIQVIENMETLSELSVLILSHNKIQDVDSLHTRLGNINSLNLSANKIRSLQGFSKLFSISELQLESNAVSSIEELGHLSKLPCLEILNLQHNPVTLTIDYRPQVFLFVGSMASDLMLDGLKPTEKEMDTVSILKVLKQSRCENSSLVKNTSAENRLVKINEEPSSKVQKSKQILTGKEAEENVTDSMHNSSKFRQKVETLRKIGGTDWLHLFNEFHNSEQVKSNLSGKKLDSHHFRSQCSSDNTTEITDHSQVKFRQYLTSLEISYPDWLLNLDSSCFQFVQLPNWDFDKNAAKNTETLSIGHCILTGTAKVVWIVLMNHQENSIFEVPVCIIMTYNEIMFLQLKKISKTYTEIISGVRIIPEFTCVMSISSKDLISLIVGPCDAYAELKIKKDQSNETIIFLLMDTESAATFVSEFHHFYHIMPSYKLSPFAKKMLELEAIESSLSFSDISVQKQILFGQRISISKVLHKCQLGVLHYVFITPSHVLLIEEKLRLPSIDINDRPPFQICSIINVHSNIKQIQLEDIQEDFNLTDVNEQDNNLDVLYKCGSWLIIEFETKLLLYLKFFTLKQRNEFLDIFLCVRNQR